ncbi:MAG: hypothetical protein WA417_17715, partial [Stellaceae bacterium]
ITRARLRFRAQRHHRRLTLTRYSVWESQREQTSRAVVDLIDAAQHRLATPSATGEVMATTIGTEKTRENLLEDLVQLDYDAADA